MINVSTLAVDLQVTDGPFVNETGACLVGQGTEGIWFGGYRPAYANCTIDSAIFQVWLLDSNNPYWLYEAYA